MPQQTVYCYPKTLSGDIDTAAILTAQIKTRNEFNGTASTLSSHRVKRGTLNVTTGKMEISLPCGMEGVLIELKSGGKVVLRGTIDITDDAEKSLGDSDYLGE